MFVCVCVRLPLLCADSNWPQYQFQYHTPSDIAMTRIRRRRERDRSRIGLKSLTGCARSEGILPGGRRSAAVEAEGNATAAKYARLPCLPCCDTRPHMHVCVSSPVRPSALAARVASRDDSAASAGGSARSGASLSSLYRTLNSKPLEERVRVRRSEIHGWGLYVMSDVPKHTMVIEYCGEVIGQAVADKREKRCGRVACASVGQQYAHVSARGMHAGMAFACIAGTRQTAWGVATCSASTSNTSSMLRTLAVLLGSSIIAARCVRCACALCHVCVRACVCGVVCKHSPTLPSLPLQPNSYSRIVTIDGAKHIIIFAMRDLAKGEEVTYDYKFPLEDEGIPCRCGAANCRGRMN